MNKQRIIFMGTPDFSVSALKALVEDPTYEVVCVYTQPPRPAGRGHRETPSPVHAYAHSQGIEVRTPTSLKTEDSQHDFHDLEADLAVVAAYGLLLPQAILDSPRLGCLNIHASLLPRWRGAAPIQRAIEAGDLTTGITLMQMEAGLDTGPMLETLETPIERETTAQDLHDTLSELGANLLMDALPKLFQDMLEALPQPEEGVTYAKKITKEEGQLDWDHAAEDLFRKMRALTPWPGVWFAFEDTRIKVLDAEFILETLEATPGTILTDELHIACGEGVFRPTVLQRPGGRPLEVLEFLRGFPLPAGTVLS